MLLGQGRGEVGMVISTPHEVSWGVSSAQEGPTSRMAHCLDSEPAGTFHPLQKGFFMSRLDFPSASRMTEFPKAQTKAVMPFLMETGKSQTVTFTVPCGPSKVFGTPKIVGQEKSNHFPVGRKAEGP